MGRAPCCDKVGLKKGPWTPEEDQKLVAYIQEHGHGSWRALPQKAGLLRCGKSCRLRWANYLRPDIKRGKFSVQEEQTIIQLHALLGNRWSAIATHLPKRTDNEIKNYWNTHLKKRLVQMGIDPVTHKPKADTANLGGSQTNSISSSNVSHMAQWESARLEAESRLVRESKLRAKGLWSSSTSSGKNLNYSISDFHSKSWRPASQGFESVKFEGISPGLSSTCGGFEWMRAIQKWDKSADLFSIGGVSSSLEEDRSSGISNGTSYLSLLQQAMCPSAQGTKLLYKETKKIVDSHKIQLIDDKKPVLEKPHGDLMLQARDDEQGNLGSVELAANSCSHVDHLLPSMVLTEGNCSSGKSDVSELSKTEQGDGSCYGESDRDQVMNEFEQHLNSSDEISSREGFKTEGGSYHGLISTDMFMDLVAAPPSAGSVEDRSMNGLCADDNKDYWCNMFTMCNSPQGNHVGVQSIF